MWRDIHLGYTPRVCALHCNMYIARRREEEEKVTIDGGFLGSGMVPAK